MNKILRKTLKKEIVTAVSTAVIITLFSISFWILPPLGNLINPVGNFWNATKGPFDPLPFEEITIPGLAGENVTVYRDNYGVPHIYAQDYKDLYFAYGYCMAQDRFFELTLMKLIGWGRLSEVIGDFGVSIDKYLRTLSLWKAGEELMNISIQEKDLYPQQYNVIDSYTRGINYWLDTHQNNLPIEFSILSLPVEHWELVDSAVMANLAGLLLSWATSDLKIEEAQRTLGPWLDARIAQYGGFGLDFLYPDWNMSYPYETPVLPDNHSMNLKTASGECNSLASGPDYLLGTIQAFLQFDQHCRNLLSVGSAENSIGSNNWVINGSMSTTGMPILCGDPHLMYLNPSVWYEVHLVCPSGGYTEYTDPKTGEKYSFANGYNSYGVGFLGTPIVLIGHNAHCAWSETVVGSDTFVDFYNETMNADKTKYYFNGSWNNVEVVNSPIKVKNGPFFTEEPFEIRYTRHGPLISDVMTGSSELDIVTSELGMTATDIPNLSAKWIAYNNSNEYNILVAFDLLNRAENVTGIKFALDHYPNPPMNFAVADDSGNIGMICAGLYPIRAKNGIVSANYTGRYVQPGDGTGEEWVGFIQPEHLPHCINPINQSYLASANQRTIAAAIYNYSIGWEWTVEWRARSINRYLNASNPASPYYGQKLSVHDMEDIQYSSFDIAAEGYVPILLNMYDNLPSGQKDEYSGDFKSAIELLRSWNNSVNYQYQMETFLIAPTIFDKWLALLPENVWGDEYAAAGMSPEFPMGEVLEYLVREGGEDNAWFDNVSTTSMQETKTGILLSTLNETMLELAAKYGSLSGNPQNWLWGNHHVFGAMGIPLIFNALLNRRVDTFPVPGSERTLNNAPKFDIIADLGPFHIDLSDFVLSGPSWRQIIDFSAIEQSIGILPGGESENIASKHYFDQAPMWAAGNYKTLLYYASPQEFVKGLIESTLILRSV